MHAGFMPFGFVFISVATVPPFASLSRSILCDKQLRF